jgi:hypothetical protein
MAKLIPSLACLGSAKFCPLNHSFDQYSIASNLVLTASIEQGTDPEVSDQLLFKSAASGRHCGTFVLEF